METQSAKEADEIVKKDENKNSSSSLGFEKTQINKYESEEEKNLSVDEQKVSITRLCIMKIQDIFSLISQKCLSCAIRRSYIPCTLYGVHL